jgi:hypothetical protein
MSASALLACWLTCLRAWPSFRALSPCLGRMSLPLVGFVRLTSLPADLHPRVHSRARRPLGRSVPDDRSRSVFAVSHRPDGFLLHGWCGLVASRCRTEGSPRFPLLHGAIRKPLRNLAFPATPFTPPEGPPSSAAAPRHRGRCPPAVIIRSAPLLPRVLVSRSKDRSLPAARSRGTTVAVRLEGWRTTPFTVGPARYRRPPGWPSRAGFGLSGHPFGLPWAFLRTPSPGWRSRFQKEGVPALL